MLSMRYSLFLLAICSPLYALDPETVEVTGKRYSWLQTVQTASEGQVDHEQLQQRPILRPGEIMESVPGLITTQHSGTGKANQYFLRGFNLDHGTDFASFVDGIPINMPSHGHGQGYTDLNFLVPEILDKVEYGKGPYDAEYGDFSGAGHVELKTMDVFPHGLVQFTAGSYDYKRLLVLDSIPISELGQLSYAVEGTDYQGPWSGVNEDLRKKLAWMKFVAPTEDGQHTLSILHYDATWNAADQIPVRAVRNGSINRLGTIDPTTGGETRRDSISWIWTKKTVDSSQRLQIYGVNYGLNLWSNLSYFLEDPVNGDQFEQEDRRIILGASLRSCHNWSMGAIPGTFTMGLQNRFDRIDNLGLYRTSARVRESIKDESAVRENQTGIFIEQEWYWTSNFRSTIGLRHDQVTFHLQNKVFDEKREETAQITSPKFGASYRLSPGLQIFASAGQSFHSNDARGVTSKNSPAPGFVPVRGYEIGSSYDTEYLRMSLAVWRLQLDSELIYVGDIGATEAARASRREGIDWLLQLAPSSLIHADLELSWARARFTSDPDAEGKLVEGHLPFVAMMGLGTQWNREWAADARVRHFAKRPLLADGSQESEPTTMLNIQVSYERNDWKFGLDVLNTLNSRDHDIDYYYESQLQTESEPVSDLHYHPVEPRSLRFHFGRRF